ncbi:MAG: HIRAN domain-containing protein [Actinomycetota bacterium]
MRWVKLLFGAKAASTARRVEVARSAVAAAPAPRAGPVRLSGSGDFAQEVVGESFNQDALDAICGGKCEDGHDLEVAATLQPEPSNPYDKNAVAVLVRGRKVAHLSRDDAVDFHREMRRLGAAGQSATCAARINGGWRRERKNGSTQEGHYGVALDLEWPLERA